MKKQTAVSWLEKRADEREKNNPNESSYWHLRELQKDFEQAKEMEKQQIIDAHLDGQSLVSCKNEYAEQYYKDTFKN
jgi:hypothetical protein